MSKQFDFKAEWPRVKKELLRVSQEALDLAKKGEKQIVRLSKQGKTHVDMTALNLKREHLFLQMGKEYIKSKCPGQQSVRMKKLIKDFKALEAEKRILRTKGKSLVASSPKPRKVKK